MPRKIDLTWEEGPRRWIKRYRKRRYLVSCRELRDMGLHTGPDTKEGSYRAANQWWTAKRAEINAEFVRTSRKPLPLEDLAASLVGTTPEVLGDRAALVHVRSVLEKVWPYLQILRTVESGRRAVPLDRTDLSPSEQTEIRERLGLGPDDPVAALTLLADTQEVPPTDVDSTSISPAVLNALIDFLRTRAANLVRDQLLTGDPLPDAAVRTLSGNRVQELDTGVKRIRGEAATIPDRMVKTHVAAGVARQGMRVRAGEIGPARYKVLRQHLGHFEEYLGPESDLDHINAAVLDGFYQECLRKVANKIQNTPNEKGWKRDYADKVHKTARIFVRWLSDLDLIERPKNLDSRFPFKVVAKQVRT